MGSMNIRKQARLKRKKRIRKKIHGTSDRPRLSVFRSARHTYAQIIDDSSGKTLASSTSGSGKSLTELAAGVGSDIAKKATTAKVKRVVLEKGSRKYHQRLNALAEAARKEGLEF